MSKPNESFGLGYYTGRNEIFINREPWFVGSDVARCLGYHDQFNMTRILDEDEMIFNLNNTLVNREGTHGNPNVNIINESGLYSLIFSSRLPSAKEFKHWVTSEVLPTMRSIGFTNSMSILRQENERLKQEIDVYKNLHNPNKALFDLLVNTGKIQIGEKY